MKQKNLPGAWVLESFRRGDVDLTDLIQQLPDDVHRMLYEMDTILPDSIERLLQASAEISGHQDFGLMMNEFIDLSMYGLLGYLLLNSGTVEDLFNTLERYHSVHHSGGLYYKTIIHDDIVTIRFYYENDQYAFNRHTTDWGLGFIPFYLKPILAELAQPLSAQFAYDTPKNTEKLESYFGSHLQFNQTHNQLIYPRSILKEQLSDIDRGLLKILRIEADKCLLGLKKENQFLKEIKIILFQNLEKKKVNATDIAQALNISLSTFKRKLNEEGIDFKKTKDAIKNDIALKLLTKTNVSISEIAQKTGYKNPSSFTRFFIRYNNQKPFTYRKKS